MDYNFSIEGLAASGSKLTLRHAIELERRLEMHPTDTVARVQLIGYYFNEVAEAATLTNRVRHIGWFIKNRPEHPILSTPFSRLDHLADEESAYKLVKTMWLEQVNVPGQEVGILLAAAYFLFRADPKLAKFYLLRVVSQSPENLSAQIGLKTLESRNV